MVSTRARDLEFESIILSSSWCSFSANIPRLLVHSDVCLVHVQSCIDCYIQILQYCKLLFWTDGIANYYYVCHWWSTKSDGMFLLCIHLHFLCAVLGNSRKKKSGAKCMPSRRSVSSEYPTLIYHINFSLLLFSPPLALFLNPPLTLLEPYEIAHTCFRPRV